MFDNLADKARDMLFLNSGIYLESNKVMTIENCNRIEEYNDVFMSFVSGGLNIRIWGSGLCAYDYRTGGLVVRGCISHIELVEKRRADYDKTSEEQSEDKRKR